MRLDFSTRPRSRTEGERGVLAKSGGSRNLRLLLDALRHATDRGERITARLRIMSPRPEPATAPLQSAAQLHYEPIIRIAHDILRLGAVVIGKARNNCPAMRGRRGAGARIRVDGIEDFRVLLAYRFRVGGNDDIVLARMNPQAGIK